MRVAAECIPTLVLVLGDQLDARGAAFDSFDVDRDAVLMIEAPGEAAHVWSVKPRIAIFLSAMRHFRDELRARGLVVHYVALEDDGRARRARGASPVPSRACSRADCASSKPASGASPGPSRTSTLAAGVELHVDADRHFFCSRSEFERVGRRRSRAASVDGGLLPRDAAAPRVLLDDDGGPEGGRWNYDAANRKGWPKSPASRAGPGLIAAPEAFAPDAITREVIALVERRFPGIPASLADFAWPVWRADALSALETFVAARLDRFGDSRTRCGRRRLSAGTRSCRRASTCTCSSRARSCAAAEAAYRRGDASLTSTEGFVRQILGWREYMRGDYWRSMPGLAEANHSRPRVPCPAGTGAARRR